MYARLVVGMQSQCVAAGFVHPLTRKSLQDILRTKQAKEEELEHLQEEEEGEGWEFSYRGDEEEYGGGSAEGPLPSQPLGGTRKDKKPPAVSRTPSDTSMISYLSTAPPQDQDGLQEDFDDEECVFSLEL